MLKFRLKLCVIFLIFVPIAKAGDVNTTKLLADVLDHCYARHKSPIPTENMAKLLVKRSIQAMRNTVATDGVANTVTERPNLENLMANATKKMMDHTDRPITRYVPSPQVSAKCNLALVMVTMEIALNFTNVAPVICPIVESTGRPGPDLLKGNTIWKGARTTCESVQNYKVNAAVNVTLGLHRATLNPKKLSPNGSCECHGPTSIDWEFCFFDICSPEDIRLILGERAPKQVNEVVCDIVKYTPYKFEFTLGRIVFLSIIALYLLISLGISIFTVISFPPGSTVDDVRDNSTNFMRILVAFSIPFNLFKFFSTPLRAFDSNSLNILAALSLIWLILGEASNLYTNYGRNPLDVSATLKTITSQAKTQFRITFETFIFILAAKIGLYFYKNVRERQYEGEKRRPNVRQFALRAWKGFLPFALVYFLIILAYVMIIREYLTTEMPLLHRTMGEEDKCRDFYFNFLFINNFVGKCLPNTFIIPLGLQLALFLTLLYVGLSKVHKMAAFGALASLVVLSAVTRGLLVYFYDLPPTYIAGYDIVDKEKFDFFKNNIYKLPWNYIAAFACGLIYGCYKTSDVFSRFRNVPCPVNLSPLLITPGILVLLAFSVSRFYNEFKLMSQPYRFVFSALMPVIWALTLLWFVLLFRSKNPLFKLLVEWPGWQRVAVLTPVALALREIVYHLVAGFGLPMFEFFDSNQLTVLLGIPSLVIIILISTLLHVTFVMPLHQVFNAFIEE
ncbi:unnamed protein product [Bursaphelenchus xylophilus]|uniref:(pine wood nematode) hypothetical protein n=1 Tax=Bursaphelenchus xylophilus TaxID=6326 RepID=A0A7I8WP98_BURXY|nr:unnamed protein product [Bursaphelenchus xylophilus]CAG9094409.1 unnamed protein product [Bursaphelenchus xylophilus]